MLLSSLVPHSTLWSGISTRGPTDQACTSSRLAPPHRAARKRRALRPSSRDVSVYVEQGTAVLPLLSPSPKQSNKPDYVKDTGGGPSGDDGDDGSREGGRGPARLLASFREDQEQEARLLTSPKILKINIDLLLWRCRTARIRARLTLDAVERRTLYKSAEEGLRRCLALDPSDARAYVVLGKTLLLQKRYDEARALYQDGCSNTGNTNPYIWSAWGWLEAQTGNADRARKLYDAAVVVDGTHACAWHKWGMLEKAQGNYARARDLWMQGIQRCRRKPQSQNAYLYCALGCMAAQLGRVGEARAWFEEGSRTAEGAASVALWQAWAVLEAKQGDPTAVRYLFRKALQANAKSRYVHLAWAMWERRQGNLQQSVMLLQRGCQLNPTDPALFQAWALVEKAAGRFDRARILFERGLKADPSHLHLWQAYGVMEAQQGNMDRARQLFQEGVWADPRSPSTVYLFHAWGALEWSAGNAGTARELFKAAIRVDPKNETVWASWIAMESELGFVERADELRIRQAEQQWEFVVPAGFTTRPANVGAVDGPASPLAGLADTLSRFFSARGWAGDGGRGAAGAGAGAQGQAAGSAAGAAGGAAASSGTGSGSLAGILPQGYAADYGAPLSLQDIERQLQPGDPSAFPDFATPALGDDELEVALLQRPAAAARGGGGAGGVGSRASSGPSRPASAPAAMAAARDGPARGTGPQGAAAVAAVAASPVAAAGGAELSNGNGNGNGRVEQESGSGDIGVSGMSWEVDEEEAMELLGAGEAGGGTRGGGGEQQGPLQLAPRPTAMRRRQRPAQRQQEQQQVQ